VALVLSTLYICEGKREEEGGVGGGLALCLAELESRLTSSPAGTNKTAIVVI